MIYYLPDFYPSRLFVPKPPIVQCSLLGYVHVPLPGNASHSSLEKPFMIPHESGQHRLISFPHSSQSFLVVLQLVVSALHRLESRPLQSYSLPQFGEFCRQVLLSFTVQTFERQIKLYGCKNDLREEPLMNLIKINLIYYHLSISMNLDKHNTWFEI